MGFKMLTIDHVVPFIGDESSGPAHSVPALCNALNSLDSLNVSLHTLKPLPSLSNFEFSVIGYSSSSFLKRLGISSQMKAALYKQAETSHIIHNHSLWMLPNLYPAIAVEASAKCKLIVSPRGTLSKWALNRSKWKKKIMWFLGQNKLFDCASGFHATSDLEYLDIRRLGYRQPIAVISNGISIPATECSVSRGSKRTLLFLGRVHPVKGLENLLYAWKKVSSHFPDWQLKIAGPHSEYSTILKNIVTKAKVDDVIFAGEISGSDKLKLLTGAEVLILPSFTENFGMVVAEALAVGTPVITSLNTPWEIVQKSQCGWWIDNSVESLVKQLMLSLVMSSEELAKMGDNGQQLMIDCYSWGRIAGMMEVFYQWICRGGDCPQFVRLD